MLHFVLWVAFMALSFHIEMDPDDPPPSFINLVAALLYHVLSFPVVTFYKSLPSMIGNSLVWGCMAAFLFARAANRSLRRESPSTD